LHLLNHPEKKREGKENEFSCTKGGQHDQKSFSQEHGFSLEACIARSDVFVLLHFFLHAQRLFLEHPQRLE